ncbi:hypothetical protein HQN87_20765 [Paenibacillus tritici]|uniref:Uncharacterized protein n=1 Tax=Paenibacillus tritici TaxID=1873425 RepID=A0ABX2DSY9_9BACL|nr:hypothetical protein [Paenibacillus tritici]NQX47760.1 hypothetical protein [Paenibacillus tritici]
MNTNSYHTVSLEAYHNTKGVTWPELGIVGILNHGFESLAGHLMPNGQVQSVGGVPFLFPRTDTAAMDLVSCEEQVIQVECQQHYDRLFFLGFCCWGEFEDLIELRYSDGVVERKKFGFFDWHRFYKSDSVEPAWVMPYFCYKDEKVEWETVIYVREVQLDRTRLLHSIQFPDNPYMLIVCATLNILDKNFNISNI